MNLTVTGEKRRRIAVLHQGFIPTYRVAFFDEINRHGDFEYVIYHGEPPSNTGHRAHEGPFSFPNRSIRNHEIRLFGKRIIYQACLLEVLRGGYAALVLGQEAKFISNLLLFVLFKLRGKPVALWGHGYAKEELSSGFGPFRALGNLIRTSLVSRGDMCLVYTEGGAKKLEADGVSRNKITVLRNTIDTREQDLLAAKYADAETAVIRRELDLLPDSAVLLYVGRLYREKKVDELLTLSQRLCQNPAEGKPVEVVIIGGGPELPALRLTEGLLGVRFLGEIYDQDLIARYMRVASAMVIPGKVGLAIVHAFAHGLPVITRDHRLHAPEIEYLEDGQNGLIVSGDFDRFVGAVKDFAARPELQKSLAEGARQSYRTLTMEYMVSAFNEAMIRMLG